MVDRMQRLSLQYHDSRGTADSLYRIQYDAPAIQNILVDGAIPFVTATITLSTMIVATARLDWPSRWSRSACAPCCWSCRVCTAADAAPVASREEAGGGGAGRGARNAWGVARGEGIRAGSARDERFVGRSREGMIARLRFALLEDASACSSV